MFVCTVLLSVVEYSLIAVDERLLFCLFMPRKFMISLRTVCVGINFHACVMQLEGMWCEYCIHSAIRERRHIVIMLLCMSTMVVGSPLYYPWTTQAF